MREIKPIITALFWAGSVAVFSLCALVKGAMGLPDVSAELEDTLLSISARIDAATLNKQFAVRCSNRFNPSGAYNSIGFTDWPQNAIVQSPCFSDQSFGNQLSNYFEAVICANVTGMHYLAAPKMQKKNPADNMRLFDAFPGMFLHPRPTSGAAAQNMARVKSKCQCGNVCHEVPTALMHSHMHIVRYLFRNALESYFGEALQNSQTRLNLSKVGASLHINYRHPNGTRVTYEVVSGTEARNRSLADVSAQLPFIPDAAIHYRCGDNTRGPYGFMPFLIFKKVIPQDARHVYVMSENPHRKQQENSVARCDAIFARMQMYLVSKLPKATVVIMRGHDMAEDMGRLTYAKVSVCSISTFCFWPAVSNVNAAYFPKTPLIARERADLDYGPAFHWLDKPEYKAVSGEMVSRGRIGNAQLVELLSA